MKFELEPREILALLHGAHDVTSESGRIVYGLHVPEILETVGQYLPDSPALQSLYSHGLISPLMGMSNWRTHFFITPEGWRAIGEYMAHKTEAMAAQILGNFLMWSLEND